MVFLAIIGGLWYYNIKIAQEPLDLVLFNDPRNQKIVAKARFADWVDSDSLQFDLVSVSGEASKADVFRVLLQYAKAQQGRRFDKVVLSYRGKRKFLIPGDYFQELGREYDTQNPIYTIRTFPQHLLTPDGRPAFESYSGGWLAVLGKEMDQANKFHDQWYLDEMQAEARSRP